MVEYDDDYGDDSRRRAPRRRMDRTARAHAVRVRRRRRTVGLLTLVALGVVVAAAVMLGSKLWGGRTADFAGDGKSDVLIEVHPGDTTGAIARTLVDQKVIADAEPFVTAGVKNRELQAIQPGFYKMRTEVSADSAIAKLVDPANRMGKLTVPEGRQLDDITDLRNDKVVEGVLTLIAQASCVTLNGTERCVSAADLKNAASNESPQDLNVPEWAIEPVTKMGNDHRRLEGLIEAGTWSFDPTGTPKQILASLIQTSADHYAANGLSEAAQATNMTPYEILTAASLLQKEAKPGDFAKVARVIYNRLNEPQRLEFDSTVNYPLDRQEVATADADRARVTPWNTYASDGLPATPVGSPGAEALNAAEHPEAGDWLYFVTVDLDGTTLFTHDYQQHLANIELAKRNGVLDSAR